jgi:hypothetical protein
MQKPFQEKTPLLQDYTQKIEAIGERSHDDSSSPNRIEDKAQSINKSLEEEKDYKHTSVEEESDDDDEENQLKESSKSSRKTINLNDSWRTIKFDRDERYLNREERFRGNRIHTSKYTLLNFLPKNLFFQF